MKIKHLKKRDTKRYLSVGTLTEPFIEDNMLSTQLMLNYHANLALNGGADKLTSLFNYIFQNVSYSHDVSMKLDCEFQRNAKEIWESGCCVDAMDFAVVFATLARQMGIPTAILHTAEYEWVRKLRHKEDCKFHVNHTFCECYLDNKWVLIDPLIKKTTPSYSLKKICLDYDVFGNRIFIPYYRGVDLGDRQTIKEHNQNMEEVCSHIKVR